MAEPSAEWCLIESDPGVFTQLIKKFGTVGVQVEEIWSMDETMFDNLRPVHGLLFLFKFLLNEPPTGTVVTNPDLMKRMYFSKQMINNACATQAVVNLLLNCDHPDLQLGPEMTKLKEFTRLFDPTMRGLTLSNSMTIRATHNSMSQQYIFEEPGQPHATEEDTYHYVTYIPFEGRIYELDGLREGPIDHGPTDNKDWLDVVRPIITARIQKYTQGEINFNLMALVSDRKLVYERQLNELLASQLLGMETDDIDIDSEVARLRMFMDFEDLKMDNYASENSRRRHNYLPFIVNLLQVLAEQKKLMPLWNKCKDRAQRRGKKRLKR